MSVEVIGANLSSSTPTTITAPVSNNTKGAWTQLSAATPISANGIILALYTGGINSISLIDVGIGASGAESVIVSNLLLEINNSSANRSCVHYVPVFIPANARVSVRYQASSTSGTVLACIYLLNDPTERMPLMRSVTTYGADTSDSGGTSVDAGASANTKGSYSQIVAAATENITHLSVIASHSNNAASNFNSTWLVDIAVGLAGSEVVIVPNVFFQTHTAIRSLSYPSVGPFPVAISAGTRIAARAQSNDNNATNRLLDVTIVAFNANWHRLFPKRSFVS